MKAVFPLMIWIVCGHAVLAQKEINTTMTVENQKILDVELDFASNVKIKLSDKREVAVYASVLVNDGEDNDIFELKTRKTDTRLVVEMDKEVWDRQSRQKKRNCWNSDILVEITIPRSLEISFESISSDYEMEYYGKPLYLKTISGDIDISIPSAEDVDFKVKTISGEVYSTIDKDL